MEAHVMRLLDFSKVFKITCDASGIRIRGVLSQKSIILPILVKN